MRRRPLTPSISGQAIGTTGSIIRNPRVTFRPTSLVLTIWMNTVHGVTLPTTEMSGRLQSHPVGLLTPMGTGFISIRGDGRGLSTNLGAMLRSTMVAGSMLAASGGGRPDRSMLVRTMLRHLSPGMVADSDWGSASAADSDGARWVGASHSSRGMA
jgi:hypothetical protein